MYQKNNIDYDGYDYRNTMDAIKYCRQLGVCDIVQYNAESMESLCFYLGRLENQKYMFIDRRIKQPYMRYFLVHNSTVSIPSEYTYKGNTRVSEPANDWFVIYMTEWLNPTDEEMERWSKPPNVPREVHEAMRKLAVFNPEPLYPSVEGITVQICESWRREPLKFIDNIWEEHDRQIKIAKDTIKDDTAINLSYDDDVIPF